MGIEQPKKCSHLHSRPSQGFGENPIFQSRNHTAGYFTLHKVYAHYSPITVFFTALNFIVKSILNGSNLKKKTLLTDGETMGAVKVGGGE